MTTFTGHALNEDDKGIKTSAEWDTTHSVWKLWTRIKDGDNATIGTKTDVAVTAVDATSGSVIALLKGVITRLNDAITKLTIGPLALTKAEDAPAASGDAGIMALAIRRDAPTSDAAAGDYHALHVDALGRLRIAEPVIAAGAVALTGASGNVANASAVATLAAAASVTTHITGFEVTAAGATAGTVVNVTVAGTITGSLVYVFVVPTGATLGAEPLVVEFPDPIPASAANTAITVTLPALGAGNTHAAVVAHGIRI